MQKIDEIIEKALQSCKKTVKSSEKPSILLHSCCAPCSSSVIERLENHFKTCVFFYNPNILPHAEYEKRFAEQKKFLLEKGIRLIEGNYQTDAFAKATNGLEHLGEKSIRCKECYRFRLEKTFEEACKGSFDFFTTTLTVSPHKNAKWVKEILENIPQFSIFNFQSSIKPKPLFIDFKKEGGFQRSIELSKVYGFYRQTHCGCNFTACESE